LRAASCSAEFQAATLFAELLIERMMGRLEEALLMLGDLTLSRGTAVDVGANPGYDSYVMSRKFSHVVKEAFAFVPAERQDGASPS